MKKIYLIGALAFGSLCFAQSEIEAVGINTDKPNSTLQVNGSFGANYKEVSADYTLTEKEYYVTYTGSTKSTITLPTIPGDADKSFKGRIYKVKNLAEVGVSVAAPSGSKIRYNNVEGAESVTIPAGGYGEFVKTENGKNWDVSIFVSQEPNTVSPTPIYGYQLYVPPHGRRGYGREEAPLDCSDNKCTKGDWTLIKRKSVRADTSKVPTPMSIKTSRVELEYEYNGPLDLKPDNFVAMFTTANESKEGYPDVYTASFFGSYTDDNGKTVMKVSISRVDLIEGYQSDWAGNFLLNTIIFMKKDLANNSK